MLAALRRMVGTHRRNHAHRLISPTLLQRKARCVLYLSSNSSRVLGAVMHMMHTFLDELSTMLERIHGCVHTLLGAWRLLVAVLIAQAGTILYFWGHSGAKGPACTAFYFSIAVARC